MNDQQYQKVQQCNKEELIIVQAAAIIMSLEILSNAVSVEWILWMKTDICLIVSLVSLKKY